MAWTVVTTVSSASTTPLATIRVIELIAQATFGEGKAQKSLPKGTVNIVTGPGGSVGEELLRNPRIRRIAFTGSTPVGRHVMEVAGREIKRVTLELGGNEVGDANPEPRPVVRLENGLLHQIEPAQEFLDQATERMTRVVPTDGHFISTTDPETAYAHAVAARERAGRVGAVREAAGLAAYRSGRYAEALADLRAARRISGDQSLLPVMADCERGLGRPERALAVAASPEAETLPAAVRAELLIVASGARRDLGQPEAAAVMLHRESLAPEVGASLLERFLEWLASLFDGASFDVGLPRWGDVPFPVPCFVLTHRPGAPLSLASGTFTRCAGPTAPISEPSRASTSDACGSGRRRSEAAIRLDRGVAGRARRDRVDQARAADRHVDEPVLAADRHRRLGARRREREESRPLAASEDDGERVAGHAWRDGAGRDSLDGQPDRPLGVTDPYFPSHGDDRFGVRHYDLGIDASIEGSPTAIAFNARYLIDVLSNLGADEAALELSGPLAPGVIRGIGKDDYVHVIMPVRTAS